MGDRQTRRTGGIESAAADVGYRRFRHHGLVGPVTAAAMFHGFGARSAVHDGVVLPPVAYVLLAAGPLALIWLRRAPVAALVGAVAATVAVAAVVPPRWSFTAAGVTALYATVKAGRARPAITVAVIGLLAFSALTWLRPSALRTESRHVAIAAVVLAVTVVVAGAARARAQHLAEMASAHAERVRARAEQQRRQASEERLRIAQELHDVLGHHLSLISVQAGVGLHLMEQRPQQAREALTAIKSASAEALREVRAVLGALHSDGETAPRQPTVGLAQLAELTADAGLPVTSTVVGRPRPVPAEVDRAAYRIVRETLTNVRRHAPAATDVRIVVEYGDTALTVTVRNDDGASAPPARSVPGGTGIAGMRARAHSLGGTVDAGPLPHGGYLVRARLPVPAVAGAGADHP